jgi:hypothetical protein
MGVCVQFVPLLRQEQAQLLRVLAGSNGFQAALDGLAQVRHVAAAVWQQLYYHDIIPGVPAEAGKAQFGPRAQRNLQMQGRQLAGLSNCYGAGLECGCCCCCSCGSVLELVLSSSFCVVCACLQVAQVGISITTCCHCSCCWQGHRRCTRAGVHIIVATCVVCVGVFSCRRCCCGGCLFCVSYCCELCPSMDFCCCCISKLQQF